MAIDASTSQWRAVRSALTIEAERVVALLRSIDDPPRTPVLGAEWGVAEIATHLSQVWRAIPALAGGDLTALTQAMAAAGLPGPPLRDLGELDRMTAAAVRADPERDLQVLADRIEASARSYLADGARTDTRVVRPWMFGGVGFTAANFGAHLLHETLVHGDDIARGAGRRWRNDSGHARLAFDHFLRPVLLTADADRLIKPGAPRSAQVTYELRARGGGRLHVAFAAGALRITPPGPGRVDVYLSADPAALLLLLLGRRNPWRLIATGQLTVWGRRPWLAPRLRHLLRNP